ncbi:Single-stranded-DNA-specific exonuclease RecJ [hydrothermal vent metagenome]|uniref:Single-stranded-DNA-specific exonuclease RecJ n=1 Tax=hydrothermal vent metagenome TaxID=652676 RepID=A0A3B0U046_9ZZZZ
MPLEKAPYFLNVENSLTGRAWRDRLDLLGQRTATMISQTSAISEIVARILAGRAVEPDQAQAFLAPAIRDLMPDPSVMTDMDKFARRLAKAIKNKEKIALFGDYDVDGASSTALMVRYLNGFGLEPLWHIPDRVFEGYGPNITAIDKLIDQGATLLITLDCGTTSFEPVAHAKSRNCDVLVLDHHLGPEEMPVADALVNPNRPDDISGLGYLCAAGVAFMALVATNRLLRLEGQGGLPDLMSLLDLVALATICDVVPLKGLNRAFVVRGIEAMRLRQNPGLSSLALAAKLGGPLTPYHLGFMLGPRINAGGRIGDAGLGARLLSTSSQSEADEIAARLDELNFERQEIQAKAVEEAVAVADMEIGGAQGPSVLVLASEHWHPGIVGLVAARLRERFNRPAFAIAMRPNGEGSGSGRSMAGVDIGAAVIAALNEGLIIKGGGHAMAAGITLKQSQIAGFRAHLNQVLDDAVAKARQKTFLNIDAAITARTANVDFVNEINKVGPFGIGNSTPVFALAVHKIKYADIVGKGGHVRCTLASGDGAFIKAIAFGAADSEMGQALLHGEKDKPYHFCGTLSVDHWQGRQRVQMRLIDIADPAKPAW